MEMKPERIIYFDGVCNLCHWVVRFIIKRDNRAVFSFASLQSDYAEKAFKIHEDETENYDSVVYQTDEKIYFKSSAALKILYDLGGIWKCTTVFYVLPKPWRDKIYDLIANNRYRWFGKKTHCLIPSDQIKSRFVD
ncbi:UNVERIFIED_CONTAM: hypothetical protein GTU68_032554 [Idotea baltica]|nr:hypothetical protein [Idotea baltica]